MCLNDPISFLGDLNARNIFLWNIVLTPFYNKFQICFKTFFVMTNVGKCSMLSGIVHKLDRVILIYTNLTESCAGCGEKLIHYHLPHHKTTPVVNISGLWTC